MLELKPQFKIRPVNMALLDFPHKKKKTFTRMSEIDKFNRNVG